MCHLAFLQCQVLIYWSLFYASFAIYLFVTWGKLHFMSFYSLLWNGIISWDGLVHLIVKLGKELCFLCFKLSYIKQQLEDKNINEWYYSVHSLQILWLIKNPDDKLQYLIFKINGRQRKYMAMSFQPRQNFRHRKS